MGFTPFKLMYGEDAMLPEEVRHQSLRVMKQALAADEEYSRETIEGVTRSSTKHHQILRVDQEVER